MAHSLTTRPLTRCSSIRRGTLSDVMLRIGDARLTGLFDVHQRLAHAHADAAHGLNVRLDVALLELFEDDTHRLSGSGGDATGAHAHDDGCARLYARGQVLLNLVRNRRSSSSDLSFGIFPLLMI